MPFDAIGKVEMEGELTVLGACLGCGKLAELNVDRKCATCEAEVVKPS